MNKAMSSIPSLITFADQDGIIPPSLKPQAEKLYGNHAQFKLISGGHQAILTDAGRDVVLDWITELEK